MSDYGYLVAVKRGKERTVIDETNMSQEKKWLYEERAKRVIASLLKKNINAEYVRSCTEAHTAILNLIPDGAIVACGDSVSVDQTGVIAELIRRNKNKLINSLERDTNGCLVVEEKERWQMQREAFFADVFITGANAITLDGIIVSTDALGNRVAAVIFGPTKVILVIGANKIVSNVDKALERIREIAAPINARRHIVKHHRSEFADLPCSRTGICVDCNHDWRICRYTVIIEGCMVREKGRINVIMVGEELGI